MRRIGCLVVLAILAIVGWLTRDMWGWRFIRATPTSEGGRPADTRGALLPTWQPLTPAGSRRAQTALEQLQSPRGPVFVNVAPGDLAAYIVQELSRTLPSSADSIEAAAIGDRLHVRASVRTADLGEKDALGPLALLLGDRERLQLAGTLRIIRPGLAELRVRELKIRDFAMPQPLIPRLVRQISRGQRPTELSSDGLALKTPSYIGDVRVSDGRVTLYKSVQPR